jgi:hypothetical protein
MLRLRPHPAQNAVERLKSPAALFPSLVEYWRSLAPPGQLPNHRAVDAAVLPRLLPYLAKVEVLADPLDFRFRLIGEHIAMHAGRSLAGLCLGHLMAESPAGEAAFYRRLFGFFQAVAGGDRPLAARFDFDGSTGIRRSVEIVAMPLAGRGGGVDRLLAAMAFAEMAGVAMRREDGR